MTQSIEMPQDFPKRVHEALRAWHNRQTRGVLDDLFLAHQLQAVHEGTARLITNQIVADGLEQLKQSDADAAKLLERRFLDREKAFAVANSLNLGEDVVYQRQRIAIVQLAQAIWAQETEKLALRVHQIEDRLEPPTYRRLFGVEERIADVRASLTTNAEPWIVALEGMGGVGKTSLADSLARKMARETHFHEIGWVSARRRLFRLSGNVELLDNRPDLTMAEVTDRLVDQFGLNELARQPDAEKRAGLKEFFKTHPCLVIVDNLETVADYQTLVSQLDDLANPTKFLLTTRYSLRNESGVYILTVRDLSRQDAFAMMDYEARSRGLLELAEAPEADLALIYEVTGGNPLAIKLTVGQIHSLSLSTVLTRFGAARGTAVGELLSFIYADAWKSLDVDSRQVLRAMLLTPGGGELEQVAAATELSVEVTANCLHRLAGFSLVDVTGGLKERRYALHQLTRAFVAQQPEEEAAV